MTLNAYSTINLLFFFFYFISLNIKIRIVFELAMGVNGYCHQIGRETILFSNKYWDQLLGRGWGLLLAEYHDNVTPWFQDSPWACAWLTPCFTHWLCLCCHPTVLLAPGIPFGKRQWCSHRDMGQKGWKPAPKPETVWSRDAGSWRCMVNAHGPTRGVGWISWLGETYIYLSWLTNFLWRDTACLDNVQAKKKRLPLPVYSECREIQEKQM